MDTVYHPYDSMRKLNKIEIIVLIMWYYIYKLITLWHIAANAEHKSPRAVNSVLRAVLLPGQPQLKKTDRNKQRKTNFPK